MLFTAPRVTLPGTEQVSHGSLPKSEKYRVPPIVDPDDCERLNIRIFGWSGFHKGSGWHQSVSEEGSVSSAVFCLRV